MTHNDEGPTLLEPRRPLTGSHSGRSGRVYVFVLSLHDLDLTDDCIG